MRSIEDAMDQFIYHPATGVTAPLHAAVRDLFISLLPALWEILPDGPEKTLAIRKLQEAQMYANLAVALTAPADISPSRRTARILPVEDVPLPGDEEGHRCVGKGWKSWPRSRCSDCLRDLDAPGAIVGQTVPGPMATAVLCECGAVGLGPNEKSYVERGKTHYSKSSSGKCRVL